MSLARRHRDRKSAPPASLAGRGAPGAVAPTPAKKTAKKAPAEVSGAKAADGQVLPLPLAYRRGLAWRKSQKLQAAAVALQAAANDNHGRPDRDMPDATPYDLMRLQLVEANRRIKLIQSVEKKIVLKRDLLPDFLPWVEGALAEAARSGAAAQDEIVVTMLVWAIDVGDYALALRIGDHVLRHNLALPHRFDRQAATLIAEEIAEAAIIALKADKPWPADVLAYVEILTAGQDMPDQVQAKLYKALGLDYLRAGAEEQGADKAVAGRRQSAQTAALAALKRALELDPRVGVKKDIEKLERQLRPEPPAPAG